MRFGSVCSGIEAASVAWHSLGWSAAFLSEIDAFPRALLQHHYPNTPLHGDFTTIESGQYDPIDVLVGGTPCQSFSVAGLRKGLADDRGKLSLEFVRLADRLKPQWLVWENVPGVLSCDGGRAFGSFVGALAQCGYGFAYRILDAKYFGVPQRRRRVFVVGHLGDWRRAAEVLFEPESLLGDLTPSRTAGQKVAGTAGGGLTRRGQTNRILGFGDYVPDEEASTLKSRDSKDSTDLIVAFGISGNDETGHCLRSGASKADKTDRTTYVASAMQVRRLTPRECERLQGFPDDYTLFPYKGKPAPDSQRYKAIGNSMAVPVMRWIGERINMVNNRTNFDTSRECVDFVTT